VPKELTALLGHPPTTSWRKGDPLPHGPNVRRNGAWILEAPDSKAADIDDQLHWIFSRLTLDMKKWRRLTARCRLDVFVGLYLEAANRGITLSPKSMNDLRRRGIPIGFDIYCDAKVLPKLKTVQTK
jgi:hypothetical protein